MNDKLSIRKTAAKMNVNNNVFLLRHKVLDCISEFKKSVTLKGTKPKDISRFSKLRFSKGRSKRGMSNYQVCIASAIDEYDQYFLEIAGTSTITSEQVKTVLKNRIKKVTCLITDCKSSYESFAKDNHIKLEQVKSGTYKNQNGYSLGNINSLHSEWSTFLSHFRGVSTKHLQHYLE